MAKAPAILDIVLECAAVVNKQLPAEARLACAADALLLGDGGVLDSLGLITLCVGIEQALSEKMGVQCAVLDRLMTEQEPHPFATLGSLAEWIEQDIGARHAA